MNVTVTHPVSGFTGNVNLQSGGVVLGFTNGTCALDLDPRFFEELLSSGFGVTPGAPPSPPPYDANLDAAMAVVHAASGSQDSAALRAAYGLFNPLTRATNLGPQVQAAIDPDYATAVRPASALSIATGLTGDDIVEPSIKYFPGGKFGWEYWLLACPYQGSNDLYENPSLWVSHDGTTWQVPAGASNPIYPTNGGGGGHNSDGDLFEDPKTGILYAFWNQFGSTASDWRVNVGSSSDGVSWSPQQVVIETDVTAIRPTSPSVIYDPMLDEYVMYCIDVIPTARTLLRYTAPAPTGPWTQSASPTFTFPLAGRSPWHLNSYIVGNQHMLLVNDTPNGGSGPGYLYLGVSNDRGGSFNFGRQPFLVSANIAGSWDSGGYYRSAMIFQEHGDQYSADLFVGAIKTDGTGWALGRTRMTFDRQRQGQALTAKVTTGEGRYYTSPSSGSPTTTAWGSGDMRLSKMLFDRPVHLSEVGVEVTTLGDAAATYRFAVYADDGSGKPGLLLADLGSTAPITATGYISVACSLDLAPGMYWITGVAQNITTTAPTVRSHTLTGDPCVGTSVALSMTLNVNGGWRLTGQTGAPRSSWSSNPPSEITANAPRVIWKVT